MFLFFSFYAIIIIAFLILMQKVTFTACVCLMFINIINIKSSHFKIALKVYE